jgi:hypothetical protein
MCIIYALKTYVHRICYQKKKIHNIQYRVTDIRVHVHAPIFFRHIEFIN